MALSIHMERTHVETPTELEQVVEKAVKKAVAEIVTPAIDRAIARYLHANRYFKLPPSLPESERWKWTPMGIGIPEMDRKLRSEACTR